MNLPPHQLVASQTAWLACLAELNRESRLGIDLEANSMYAYREQVCLVQITIPAQDYIIDPLAVDDLSGLGRIIENPAIEKVFHAAEYDLMLLKRQFGWQCVNLFDTMWAARILGCARFGLANLLQERYEVSQDKRHQKANWCRRPLTPDMLTYAQRDTHYLLRLRDQMAAELMAAGCMEEALEIFAEQTQVSPNHQQFDPDGFWTISGAYDLTRPQQAILKALYAYRDQEAARRNQPLFKILGDKTLLELAQSAPTTMRELHQVQGMSEGQVQRYGRQLLQSIAAGQNSSPPAYPKRNNRPSDAVAARYEKLHTWRKERAMARGVESDVILSRDAMWAIAHQNSQSMADLAQLTEIGEWRRQKYGEEIVQLLRKP